MTSIALMLKPLMIVHGVSGQESKDGNNDVVVVLGLQKPRVDWMKFVVCCCMAGIEVSKQVTLDRASASMGYRWRLMFQKAAQLQRALAQFQRTMPPISEAVPLVSPPIQYPVLDPYMKVYEVEQVDDHYLVTGQPRSDSAVPWKGLVGELLMVPGVVDVAKVYLVRASSVVLYYTWRVIWKVPEQQKLPTKMEIGVGVAQVGAVERLQSYPTGEEGDYPAAPEMRKLASSENRETQKTYADMDMSVEEVVQGATKEAKDASTPDVVSESMATAAGRVRPEPVNLAGERVGQQSDAEMQKAVDAYRAQCGMTQGPDGKWRVPLDQNGRVSKVVLFNPAVLRVSGVRVDEVTRSLLEGGGRK
jgi:hypothetical protein